MPRLFERLFNNLRDNLFEETRPYVPYMERLSMPYMEPLSNEPDESNETDEFENSYYARTFLNSYYGEFANRTEDSDNENHYDSLLRNGEDLSLIYRRIRHSMPELVTDSLVSTTPLEEVDGHIYYVKYYYTTNTTNTTKHPKHKQLEIE